MRQPYGRIAAVTDASVAPPTGAHAIPLEGRTVMPGLVGMHIDILPSLKEGDSYGATR